MAIVKKKIWPKEAEKSRKKWMVFIDSSWMISARKN